MVASAFLFDVDGTLWDSYPFYAGLLASAGAVDAGQALVWLRQGYGVVRLARALGIGRTRLFGLTEADAHRVTLYPGVAAGLGALASRATLMAVVTSLPGPMVEAMLAATGVAHRFGAVVHAGNCRSVKPSPCPILAALRGLGLTPGANDWYVGDLTTDAESASEAGFSFAWAPYGYGAARPPGARAVLNAFLDVVAL